MNENKDNPSNNALQEVIHRVLITPEDAAGAMDFWAHFEVPMPSELKQAFELFIKDPSLANQQELKFRICQAVAFTEHEAFSDEMFKEIVAECDSTFYDLKFDRDLENKLTDTNNK